MDCYELLYVHGFISTSTWRASQPFQTHPWYPTLQESGPKGSIHMPVNHGPPRIIWQFLTCCFIKFWQNFNPVRPKNIPNQIYPRYIQDIQDKYKIPSGRRPGPAENRPKPGAARPRVPGRPVRGPGLGPGLGGAGPAAAWYFVFILDILDIFGYIFGIFFMGRLGSNLNEATNEKLPYINCFTDVLCFATFSKYVEACHDVGCLGRGSGSGTSKPGPNLANMTSRIYTWIQVSA